MNHHRITKKERPLEETFNVIDTLKLRVISNNGMVIGTVSQIRIHPHSLTIEGILVKQGLFKKPLYIGASYIKSLTHDSFMLKVDPTILVMGRKVIDADGVIIGKVKRVVRKRHTNIVSEIIVSSLLSQELSIPVKKIKSFGELILLKSQYHDKKKYIWQKSE